MPQLTPPRIRMPRVTPPGRASRRAPTGATTPATDAKTTAAREAPTREAPSGEAAKPAPGTEAPGATAPQPNLQERMEGLQGWMAEIERRQGRIAYFGSAALLIAIAAAGAALYFGITAKNDSATKGDVDALSKRVDALQAAVTRSSKNTQDTLNSSITQLQATIATLQKQQAQNAATISTLQSQATAGALGKKAGVGSAATPLPGATTTTTPKKP